MIDIEDFKKDFNPTVSKIVVFMFLITNFILKTFKTHFNIQTFFNEGNLSSGKFLIFPEFKCLKYWSDR